MPKRNFADVFIGANPLGKSSSPLPKAPCLPLVVSWSYCHLSSHLDRYKLWTCWRKCWCWTLTSASQHLRLWPTRTLPCTRIQMTSQKQIRTTKALKARSWKLKSGKVSCRRIFCWGYRRKNTLNICDLMLFHRVNLRGDTQFCSSVIWRGGDGIVRRRCHFFHHLFFPGHFFWKRCVSFSSLPLVFKITHHRTVTFKCLPPFTSGGRGDIRDTTPHPFPSVLFTFVLIH